MYICFDEENAVEDDMAARRYCSRRIIAVKLAWIRIPKCGGKRLLRIGSGTIASKTISFVQIAASTDFFCDVVFLIE